MKIASTIDTNYLTLMTMKSYSTWWKGAELKVTVRITRSDETQSEESFSISGYHETQTSIHIPHKFQLPGGGAKKGDTIFLDAELVGGSLFKINGMALCAMWYECAVKVCTTVNVYVEGCWLHALEITTRKEQYIATLLNS